MRQKNLCQSILMIGTLAAAACGSERAPTPTRPTEAKKIVAGDNIKHLTAVRSFDAEWPTDSEVDVTLRDERGADLGKMVVVPDGPATLTLPDGTSAQFYSASRGGDDGSIHVFRKLTAGGNDLEIQTLVSHEGVVESMYYMTNQGTAAIEAIHDGQTVHAPAEIQHWLETTANIPDIIASSAARTLYLAATDNKLMTGVMQTQGFTPTVSAYPEETTACASDVVPADQVPPTLDPGTGGTTYGDPGTGTAPEGPTGDNLRIHRTLLCSSILGAVLGAAGGSVCAACATAIAALPASAGISAIIALPACIWCAIIASAAITDIVACLRSYWNRTTQADCDRQCPAWATCTVNSDEHGCNNTCDQTKCNAYCTGNNFKSGQCGGRPGFGGNDCLCISREGTAICAANLGGR